MPQQQLRQACHSCSVCAAEWLRTGGEQACGGPQHSAVRCVRCARVCVRASVAGAAARGLVRMRCAATAPARPSPAHVCLRRCARDDAAAVLVKHALPALAHRAAASRAHAPAGLHRLVGTPARRARAAPAARVCQCVRPVARSQPPATCATDGPCACLPACRAVALPCAPCAHHVIAAHHVIPLRHQYYYETLFPRIPKKVRRCRLQRSQACGLLLHAGLGACACASPHTSQRSRAAACRHAVLCRLRAQHGPCSPPQNAHRPPHQPRLRAGGG